MVFSSRAPIGYVAIAANDLCTSQGFKSFVLDEGVNAEYVYWYLKSAKARVEALASGTTFREISRKRAEAIPIPLPSEAEQAAIVSRIEQGLLALERGVEPLDRSLELVALFRRSVAADAFQGSRSQSTLAGGRSHDALEELSLGELCDRVGGQIKTGPFGTQLHASDYRESGTPVVMPKNLNYGVISTTNIARVDERNVARLSQYVVHTGDILQSRRGDLRRRALVTASEDGWLCGTGCFIIRLGDIDLAHFVLGHLGDPQTANFLDREAVGVTMANLNVKVLRKVPLLLPDAQRRLDILNKIEGLSKRAKEIEMAVRESRKQSALLESVMLHRAFCARPQVQA